MAIIMPAIELPKPTLEELELEFLPYFQKPFSKPPFLGQIYEWASENVELPAGYSPPGKYDVGLSPMFIEPFKAIRDPNIRQVNIMAPPRSGKTLVAEITLLYLIANSPGNILWIQSTEPQMKKMSDARMSKLLHLCPPVEKLIDNNDRYAVTQTRYRFANGIEVHLASATIKSLQSFGYKYIVFDECWLSDAGLIAEAKARVGDFPNTYKIILISQGGSLQMPDWELEFNKAPVWEYGFVCPKCQKEQVYKFNHRLKGGDWAGLYWPRNDKTYVDREWIIDEAAKAAGIKCIHEDCKHIIEDTAANRDYLESAGRYLNTKPEGDHSEISFRVNALAMRKVSFGTLTKEWLEADSIQNSTGDTSLKDIFIQKRMAETPGTRRLQALVELNIFDLPPDAEWKKETIRFMTVDVQRKSPRFWWVVREWSKDSESRKIGHGSAHSWDELEQIREKHKVKKWRVLVDSGDGQSCDEVYTKCAQTGDWLSNNGKRTWFCYGAAKGFRLYNFKDNGGNKPFKIDTQRPNLGPDPKYKGVPGCPYICWSNPRIKAVLEHLRDGKGAKWLSNDSDPEYRKQLASEIAIKTKNGFEYVRVNENEPNEYWDLEALQVLMAIASGYLSITPSQKLKVQEAQLEATAVDK